MRTARRAIKSEAGATATVSPAKVTFASRQSAFARATRTGPTVLIGSEAAFKRFPDPDRFGLSHIISISRMTRQGKPSGIGSASTDRQNFPPEKV
jgi:hypothetical protein